MSMSNRPPYCQVYPSQSPLPTRAMWSHFLLLVFCTFWCHGAAEERNPPGHRKHELDNPDEPTPTPADLPDVPTVPAPPDPIDDPALQNTFPAMFFIPPVGRQQIRDKCQKKRGNCKGQSRGNANRRAFLKEKRSKSLQKGRGKHKGKNKHEADALVEDRFKKVFDIKQELYELWGLADVAEPSDDGLFGGDILLNERQIDSLRRSIQEIRSHAANLPRHRRQPRSALHFEDPSFEVQLWNKIPIPFFVDTSSGINSAQRTMIKTALSEISNATRGRVSFRELSAPIDTAPYLEFEASDSPGICGASSIGRQDFENTVYLNFNCKGSYGTILHETLHSLGVAHHHTRLDRDTYLEINWDNMDSFCLDAMALNDMNTFTSYGTPYSYGSIMHYSRMVCAVDTSIPTLTPKRALPSGTVMGQRNGLSQSDIDLLMRIYCCAGTVPAKCSCRDTSVYCGYDANVGYCTDRRYATWMSRNCAKSCSKCSC